MSRERPTNPPPRRSSRRLVAVVGATARVEAAADGVARVVHAELRDRVARALAEAIGPLPPEALAPVLALFNDGAARARQQTAEIVRAYAEELHALYASALHAVRPGLELPRSAPSLDAVLARLDAAGFESSREELATLCRTIGLDVVEPGE